MSVDLGVVVKLEILQKYIYKYLQMKIYNIYQQTHGKIQVSKSLAFY